MSEGFEGYPVISFHGQIVPSQIVPISSQIVPQNSQFVPRKSQFVPKVEGDNMLVMLIYIFRKTNYHNIEIVIRNSRCFQNLHNSSASGHKRFEILYLQNGIAFTVVLYLSKPSIVSSSKALIAAV